LDHSAHIAPLLAASPHSLVAAAELAIALLLTGLAGGFVRANHKAKWQ
jgi:hypothetical protein